MLDSIKNRIKDFRGRDALHSDINPKRDWKLLLTFFSCMVVVLFVADYILLSTSTNSFEGTPLDTTIAGLSINNAKLSDTLEVWKIRETKFNDLLKMKPAQLIDPSQ